MKLSDIKKQMDVKIANDTLGIGSNITNERSDNMAFKNGTLINKKAVNNSCSKQSLFISSPLFDTYLIVCISFPQASEGIS